MGDRKVISIDGMGGDNAPGIVVEGLERFAKTRGDLHFLLHGDEAKLKPLLASAPTASPRTEIRHTPTSIAMDAKPGHAVRRGKGSSMWNAIESVKNGEAIAAVSAGIVKGVPLLDLCYEEDSTAEVDFNVVMTGEDDFIEVQGTAEGQPFRADELQQMLDLARLGTTELVRLQKRALQED